MCVTSHDILMFHIHFHAYGATTCPLVSKQKISFNNGVRPESWMNWTTELCVFNYADLLSHDLSIPALHFLNGVFRVDPGVVVNKIKLNE